MSDIKSMVFSAQRSISLFLKEWLKKRNGFECRSFYGETFTLALLQRTELIDNEIRNKLLNIYDKLDKTDSQFHWEFNNYALLDYLDYSNDRLVKRYLKPLRFKNTPCTNWTLLRSCARLKIGCDNVLAIKEAKKKIEKFQLPSGLMLDDPGVKSFQYHCFSMAMIVEIYEVTRDKYFYESFLRGVKFIRNFILSNGDTLYIGRGQNQSFGYGVLIYILIMAYKYEADRTMLGDAEKVLGYLLKFQRDDGSFPLVMNLEEGGIPDVIDMQSPEFIGWYPYNNYFDYLPFLGFFLSKANEALEASGNIQVEYSKQLDYKDKNFIKVVRPSYTAVLSRVGGYWSNDLPIPYVVSKSKSITPCYGGEQFQQSLYNIKSIPLPYCEFLQKSIRWKSFSFFFGRVLLVFSPFGVMKREFDFKEKEIVITTKVLSPFKFVNIYLFLEMNNKCIGNAESMIFGGYAYSASGKLQKLLDPSSKSRLIIRMEE